MNRAVLLAAVGLAASCTTTGAREGAASGQSWQPLPPSTLGATRSANQRLRAAYGDQEISLDCVVNVDADHLTVIGLLPGGPRVFTVEYDGKQVSEQKSSGVPEALRPELLLNDLQLTFWPRAALQTALQNTAWRVTEPDPRTRRLTRDAKLVAEVHYASADPWTGRAWLVNFERGYSITIDSQPLQ
ncbi:MAG TPA: DUF3261 domain-containing protein [Steroidobacteraceae bacterium]|nr:DUF3261 domain-containing protein [Steroidobacteraceae bacterium]